MERKTIVIIILGILIIILIGIFAVPKVTNAYKMEGFQQGITVCQQQVMNTLVGDLSTRGYTTITIGNKVITLGIIPTEEQTQAMQQRGEE